MSDEDKKQINSPKLSSTNLMEYMHAMLTSTSISTYNGPKEHKRAKSAIKNNPCAIIFSNDCNELKQILNIVKTLSEEEGLTSFPLIFVVTSVMEILSDKEQFNIPVVGFIEQNSKSNYLCAVSAYREVLNRLNQIKKDLPFEPLSLMSTITNFIMGK